MAKSSSDPLGDALRGSLTKGLTKAFKRPSSVDMLGGRFHMKPMGSKKLAITKVSRVEPDEIEVPTVRRVKFILPKSDKPKKIPEEERARRKAKRKRIKDSKRRSR